MNCCNTEDVVDCEVQANRFEDLLTFSTQRRVLAVSDDGGRGKSTLLKKLRDLCKWHYSIPVALVPLEDFENCPDELVLVTDIAEQLRGMGVQFPAFDRLLRARSFHDVGMFARDMYCGGVDGRHAIINKSIVAGTLYEIENVEQLIKIGPQEWSDEADLQAKRICVEAFLSELFDMAHQRPVVVLFDTVESAHEKLMDWLFLALVNRRIVADANGDHKLLMVLAGRELEALLRSRFSDYDSFFESMPSLGAWRLEDTKRLLEVKGYGRLDLDVVKLLHKKIVARHMSLADALTIALAFQGERSRR